MDRRDFLRTTGAAAAAALGVGAARSALAEPTASAAAAAPVSPPSPAVVSGTRELRVAFSWPDNGQGFADSARRLLRRIEMATAGRYRFTPVITAKTGIAAVASGEADVYHASEHENLDANAGFAYFAGLPGANGLRPSALDAWMLAGGGQMLWDDLAAEHGVKALLAGHTGRSTGLWSAAPVHSIAELSGRKVWAMGLASEVVRGLGAEPSMLAPPALGRALGNGEVIAAEAGGAIASQSLGILEHAPHQISAAINQMGTALSLGFRHDIWEKMNEADRAIISAIASAELHTAIAEEKAHRHLLLAPFKSNSRSPAPELANAILRVSDAVVAHLAATNARTQRINASYVAFRRAIGIRPLYLSA